MAHYYLRIAVFFFIGSLIINSTAVAAIYFKKAPAETIPVVTKTYVPTPVIQVATESATPATLKDIQAQLIEIRAEIRNTNQVLGISTSPQDIDKIFNGLKE